MNLSNTIPSVITLVTIVGLIVLIAIGKLSWGDGGPLIAALAGVHVGSTLTNSTVTPPASPPPATVTPPPGVPVQ